jgi:hypothetical protein
MGGGELALDIDVDVTEALSEIISLMGVPGILTDAMLACRDLSLSTEGKWGTDEAEGVGRDGGTSLFGVGTTRNVLGAMVRLMGDPEIAVAGLAGTDVVVDNTRALLVRPSAFWELGAGDFSVSGVRMAAVMSSLPGCCLFVEAGVVTGVGASSLEPPFDSLVGFLCGVVPAVMVFFLLERFPLANSSGVASGVAFVSSV